MKFAEFGKYVSEISEIEFQERNRQLTEGILKAKQEMNSRGLLTSSMTMKKISNLLRDEYEVRSDFLARLISEGVGRVQFDREEDGVSKAKSLFYSLSSREKAVILETYGDATKIIRNELVADGMVAEMDKALEHGMENRLLKNNIHIEYTFKSAQGVEQSSKSVWMLTPNFYGIGIDIPALVKKHFTD